MCEYGYSPKVSFYSVLLRGGKTCADQQPDKVVGTTPMGARHPIINTPTILATGHNHNEVDLLPASSNAC